jgi:hypothetical protein
VKEYPQFADCVPIWGSPATGIVGLSIHEREMEGDGNIVFTYFDPEIQTWRIVDTTTYGNAASIADHLHQETKQQLEKHYSTLDKIVGPMS